MTLTEREVEALLSLDKSRLRVRKEGEPAGAPSKTYVARIEGGGVAFAESRPARDEAVQAVWALYQQYMDAPSDARGSEFWLNKNAEGNVEVEVARLMEENPEWLQNYMTRRRK